jgi:hypothetical protein
MSKCRVVFDGKRQNLPILSIGCIYKNKQYVSYFQYKRDLNM